jgi:hypothetical protein
MNSLPRRASGSWPGPATARPASVRAWRGWIQTFLERGWSSGLLPAGYGFGGLSTDLTATMKDKAPSLYLRKEFTLTAAQAAFTGPLLLTVEYNDGFVAFLNGREVARANAGASNRFLCASQPAFNVSTAAAPVELDLGPAHALLVPGRNVLALQTHNAEQPATPSDPTRITQHLPTPEFKINAGLRASGVTVISLRPSAFAFADAAGAVRIHANTNGAITRHAQWPARARKAGSRPRRCRRVPPPGRGCGCRSRNHRTPARPAGRVAPCVRAIGPEPARVAPRARRELAGGWTPGSITATDLANTLLRFRARAEGGTQLRLRLEPAPGDEAAALGASRSSRRSLIPPSLSRRPAAARG